MQILPDMTFSITLIPKPHGTGEKGIQCAFTDDRGMSYFMLCPLVALTEAGIRKGVVGTATNPCTTR